MDFTKVPQQINDVVGDNVKKLAQLFPSVVKDGEVDFEALQEKLGVEKTQLDEKYELNWAGKREAKRVAREDAFGITLNYCEELSVNGASTENLYIEGDNLEVLKLLRQNYYGAVKMIYIDPPYNTGNDFVYNDFYTKRKVESDVDEGIISDLGERFVVNRDSQNRYHANWLSMMYSRLYVAKDILSDDGMIFISIDDNEEHNLKAICDEIFGLDNYINVIALKTKASAGASGGGEDKRLKKNAEFILIYAKSKERLEMEQPVKYIKISDFIEEHKNSGTGFYYTRILEDFGTKKLICEIDDMKIYVHSDFAFSNVAQKMKEENLSLDEVYAKYFDRIFMVTNAQTSLLTKVNNVVPNEQMLVSYEYVPKTGKDKGRRISKYVWNKTLVVWFADSSIKNNEGVFKAEQIGTLWSDISWGRLDLQGNIPFKNGKKPIKLLERLIEMGTDDDSIVLDFFSGSATTADAVLKKNASDGGHRKFILVQIPEVIDEKNELFKMGFKTLCEIGRKRITNAIESLSDNNSVDAGYKTFRVGKTNIKWNTMMDIGQLDVNQIETTPDLVDFVPGAKDIDIVYELMLRQRDVALSESVELLSDIGNRTYLYASSFLVCLETEVTESIVEKIAAIDPLPIKFIFRDSAFKDDIALKDETFRRLKTLVEKNSGENKPTYTVEFI